MHEIWAFFKKNGFSDEGTAALLGNLYKESKLNPKNLQESREWYLYKFCY